MTCPPCTQDCNQGRDCPQRSSKVKAYPDVPADPPSIEAQGVPDLIAGASADLLGEIVGCFDAAISEGLFEAIDATTDERLKDLLQRRIMHAYTAAIGPSEALAAAPQPQPLSDQEIADAAPVNETLAHGFKLGVRWAEAAHGITKGTT